MRLVLRRSTLLLFLVGCDSHPSVDLAVPSPTPLPAIPAAPFVTFANPADDATNIDPDGTLTVVFSTSMDPATVTEGNLVLTSGTTVIDTTVSYAGFSARISPASPLAAPAQYLLSVSDAIESASGVTLSSSYAISFATGNPYPAFAVRKSDTQSMGTSNTLVTWDVVDVDDMGADPTYGWGPQPNSYVVPVSGWWLFSASLGIDATAGDRLFVAFADDNSAGAQGRAYLSNSHADTTANLTGGGSVLLFLPQGAEVSVLARSETTASPVNPDANFNRFQGQLVRR